MGFNTSYADGGLQVTTQPFTITFADTVFTAQATLSPAVNVATSRIIWAGTNALSTNLPNTLARVKLENTTTVQAIRGQNNGDLVLKGTVETYNSGVSVQRGVITITASAVSNTDTLVAFNTTRASLALLGIEVTSNDVRNFSNVAISSSTQVIASRYDVAPDRVKVSYELVEYL